jgi:hypothetical protein
MVDSAGCVFSYDRKTRVYTQLSSWGCSWSELTLETDVATYPLMVQLLKADTSCPTGTKRLYEWVAGMATPQLMNVCAAHWYGGNNAELQIARSGSNTYFSNQGTLVDMGTGWLTGYVVDYENACAVKTNQLFLLGKTGQFALFPTQPPTGWSSCLLTEDGTIHVYGNGKNYLYDDATNTWKTVAGTAPTRMSGNTKADILGIVSGQPKHLNYFPGFLSGTTSGSYNFCPTSPCTGAVTHTADIQVCLGGVCGAHAVNAGPPTANLYASSFTYNPICDALFGALNNTACAPIATGNIICSVSHAHFQGGAGSKQPPPINVSQFSIDIRSYDHTSELFATKPVGANSRIGQAVWGSTVDACGPSSHATCAGLNTVGPYKVVCVTTDPVNNPCTDADLQIKVDNYGYDHALNHQPDPRAWFMLRDYAIVNGEVVCAGPIYITGGKGLLPCK